ncbi:MAG: HAMP domain-containing sensor histidine kinase [Candidatus Neomarinimicrobiota bacterium]
MKLSNRVLTLVTGVLLVALTGMAVPLYWYTRSALEDDLDRHLLTILELVAAALDRELLAALAAEPELAGVRQEVESDLRSLVVSGITALALFDQNGTQLVFSGSLPVEQIHLTVTTGAIDQPVVSRIFRQNPGVYFKTAVLPLTTSSGQSVLLAAWAGAEFMAVVEQLLGSLFWMTVLALAAAGVLSIVFSRSLLNPVRRLSTYAAAISRNIYSESLDLGRNDEFGALNRALREMHQEIRSNEQHNKELLAGIAHEIKNPLGGIEIYSGLLEEELGDNSEHREYLNKINIELRNLKRVILEYLDYARPPRSAVKPQKIDTIVADAARILAPELAAQKINFSSRGSGTVSGDESKLRRVLVNLLKNGIEAQPEGGKITVVIEEQGQDLILRVSDSGSGIRPEHLEQVFQPHFSTRNRGYGLGLAIVKNIVDEMSGTIVVNSTVGVGSEFVLTLPRG